MRPRERENAGTSPSPSPPTATATPPVPAARGGGMLSSMVVRASESGGGSDFEPGEVRAKNIRHDTPPDFRRRYTSPDFRRRDTPPTYRHRSKRLSDDPGYDMRAGSVSPPRRVRPDYSHYDLDLDHPVGPHRGRGFRGGRGGGRFKDISPHYGPGRGGRSVGRGYNGSGPGFSRPDGEVVNRNDPNLSPREGDWICRDPTCGNLNFARREYCNNCNKFRFGPGRHRPSCSPRSPPRRGYLGSPSPHGPPPRVSVPHMDRGLRRDLNGYISPHRGVPPEDPRDFRAGSPSPRRRRFPDHMRRETLDYREEGEHRENGKFDRRVHPEWDRRDRERDGFIPEKRRYVRQTPSPPGQWMHGSRERSRSPVRDRPLKDYHHDSYTDRAQDGGSYVGRGRGDDSYIGRGRGFRRGNGSYMGRGRGDRQGDDCYMGRGRGGRRVDDFYVGRGRGDREGMGVARGKIDDVY